MIYNIQSAFINQCNLAKPSMHDPVIPVVTSWSALIYTTKLGFSLIPLRTSGSNIIIYGQFTLFLFKGEGPCCNWVEGRITNYAEGAISHCQTVALYDAVIYDFITDKFSLLCKGQREPPTQSCRITINWIRKDKQLVTGLILYCLLPLDLGSAVVENVS